LFALPEGFLKHPPASAEAVARAPCRLPADLAALYLQTNGAEGFVRGEYLRIYPVDELADLNAAFGVAEFAPGLSVFGSNAGGTAFAVAESDATTRVIAVPFIPLSERFARDVGATIADLVRELGASPAPPRKTNPAFAGKEVHHVQPVAFGGDSLHPSNQLALPTADYAKLVVWWNRKYRADRG
jgi:hypothetical protein